MIDINTPEARAKLATLPSNIADDIKDMWLKLFELHVHRGSYGHDVADDAWRLADLQCCILAAALNAAIVAAFEPLTVHDQSADVARILGGDV